MNVVHLVPALFGADGIVGGAERYAFELARAHGRRVPTTLVTFGDAARTMRAGSLRVRILGRPWYVRGQRTNPFSRRLLEVLANADVVHCHQHHVLMSSAAPPWCRAARPARVRQRTRRRRMGHLGVRVNRRAGSTGICTSASTAAHVFGHADTSGRA